MRGSSRMRWMLVFVLLVGAGLSGCVDDAAIEPSGDGDAGDGEPGGDGRPGDAAAEGTRYRFTDDEPATAGLSAAGVFATPDYCTIACSTGSEDASLERFDLVPLLPVGVPVRIDLRLMHDHEMMGSIGGYFESEGVWFLHHEWGGDYTDMWEAAIVVRPEPSATIDYVVQAFFPDLAAERGWSLELATESFPDVVPPGVPTKIGVADRNDPPRFAPVAGGAFSLLLWGPDDAFLGRFGDADEAARAMRAARAGDFVALVPLGDAALVVTSNESRPAALEALALSREVGEFHAGTPDAPVEWEFALDRVPVAVGIAVAADGTYLANTFTAELESPAGSLLEMVWACGLCMGVSAESVFEASTPPAHPDVVAGDYTARFHLLGLGYEAAHFVVHYER